MVTISPESLKSAVIPEAAAESSWSFQDQRARCPACGDPRTDLLFTSTDLLYRTTGEAFQVVRCQGCGLLRLAPPVAREHLHAFYPTKYWFVSDAISSLEDVYRRFVLRDHIRFVLAAYRRTKQQGYVLDVGCGGGLLLGMILPLGIPVLGMDFSVQAASIAWHAHSVPVVCATVDHAPLPAKSCAVITMFHVVEHLIDPVPHLKAARHLLKPDGRLIVQVPNADSWQFRLFGRHWNGIDVPRHMINYRTQDLIGLLNASGFRVQRIKHFSLRDNPAGFATSFATRLDPMVRRLTGVPESAPVRLTKSLLYLTLVIAAIPFTVLEAMFGRGSTVMMEASVADEPA